MKAPPQVIPVRFDSSYRTRLPLNKTLLEVDSAFVKMLSQTGIKTQKFGSEPEYSSYDAPAFSNTKFFDKLFDLYRDSSNEEKVILDVFRRITLQMCKQRERILYIGSENGIHPANLSLFFDDVVSMNKYGDKGDLVSRLETNINNDPRFAPHSFDVFLGSHYAYFFKPPKHGAFIDMINYLLKDDAPRHLVLHRHSGQTHHVVTDLGGAPGDGLNVAGMADLIDSRGHSQGPIYHIRSKVIISAVDLLAMMHKVGFFLMDTGANVEAAVLAEYVGKYLKNASRYSISRDDEQFIYRTSFEY